MKEESHGFSRGECQSTTAGDLVETFEHLATGAIKPVKVLVAYE
jgi:hypothetical protein